MDNIPEQDGPEVYEELLRRIIRAALDRRGPARDPASLHAFIQEVFEIIDTHPEDAKLKQVIMIRGLTSFFNDVAPGELL